MHVPSQEDIACQSSFKEPDVQIVEYLVDVTKLAKVQLRTEESAVRTLNVISPQKILLSVDWSVRRRSHQVKAISLCYGCGVSDIDGSVYILTYCEVLAGSL